MQDSELNIISNSIIVVCWVSLVPYILFLIIFIKGKQKFSLTNHIHLQLCLSNLAYNVSYLLPNKKNQTVCKVQAMINTFSEITSVSIASSIVWIAQSNFTNKNESQRKEIKTILFSIFICWVIPIVIGICSVFFGSMTTYSNFCWVQGNAVVISYIIIRAIYFFIFYFCSWRLVHYLNKEKTNLGIAYKIKEYIGRVRTYVIVVSMTFVIYALYAISDIFDILELNYFDNFWFWMIIGILDTIIHPIYTIVFIFDIKSKNNFCALLFWKRKEDNHIMDLVNVEENDTLNSSLVTISSDY